MDIIEIFKPHVYSIRFDENGVNEYDRIINQWHDLDYLSKFFSDNKNYLKDEIWTTSGLNSNDIEKFVERVIDEANALEEHLEYLVGNIRNDDKPDLDDYFHYLDGKYCYVSEMTPVKGYGTRNPSLIRLYALKVEPNCYLIVDGGIKLCDTIQNSPELKDHVLQKIDKVITSLKKEGIIDKDDFKNNDYEV